MPASNPPPWQWTVRPWHKFRRRRPDALWLTSDTNSARVNIGVVRVIGAALTGYDSRENIRKARTLATAGASD